MIGIYNDVQEGNKRKMRKLVTALDPYILLMLAMIVMAMMVPVQGDGAVLAGTVADVAIAFLFFLYGTRLSPKAAAAGFTRWKLQIAVLLCTFALFPLLGICVDRMMAGLLPEPLLNGVLVLSAMPSTVQSSIAFTSMARGNVAAALCAATLSNIIGVFLSPLLVSWLFHTGGVTVSFDVFRDIMLQLLAPFLVGQLVRPVLGSFLQRHKQVLGYADRGSILLIIYVAFSKGMTENVWSEVNVSDLLILMATLTALLTLVLLLTSFLGRRVMSLPAEDNVVLQFCGSKKSLASGLPIATLLFPGPQVALILLPLMLFHQIQLIVCAILARRRGTEADEQERRIAAELSVAG